MPPGVELQIGERWAKKDLTSYLEKGLRTVTVTGPLGMCPSSLLLSALALGYGKGLGCCVLGLALVEGVGIWQLRMGISGNKAVAN